MVVLVSRLAMVVRSPFAMEQRSSASMFALAVRVAWVVLGDIAGAAGVAGRGIRRGAEDSVGDMLDRLIDASDDIWMGQGYGRDRCV